MSNEEVGALVADFFCRISDALPALRRNTIHSEKNTPWMPLSGQEILDKMTKVSIPQSTVDGDLMPHLVKKFPLKLIDPVAVNLSINLSCLNVYLFPQLVTKRVKYNLVQINLLTQQDLPSCIISVEAPASTLVTPRLVLHQPILNPVSTSSSPVPGFKPKTR